MARTPRQETIVLAAGQSRRVQITGRWLLILSNTAASVNVRFDSDAEIPMYAGIPYPALDNSYSAVTFRDALGAGCSFLAVFSDEPVADNRGSPLAATMASALVSIDQEISGHVATLQVPDRVLAITPGPGTLILAANAVRTECEIHAPRTNGAGLVYLGITVAHASAVDKFEVLSAGESWYSDREKGAVYGTSSTGAEIVVAREC